jgi:ketosteroid isomerase-like protein
MPGRFMMVPALLFCALLPGCQAAEDAEPVDSAEVVGEMPADAVDLDAVTRAMDELEQAYAAAYNAGDAAGIAALFASDGTLAPPLSPTLDPAGIETMYSRNFELSPGGRLEIEREDMVISGPFAIGWGSFAVMTPGEDGEPIVSTGRYGAVCTRTPDGEWKIFRHLYNYEVSPPGVEG